jgi:hypothetical protein
VQRWRDKGNEGERASSHDPDGQTVLPEDTLAHGVHVTRTEGRGTVAHILQLALFGRS